MTKALPAGLYLVSTPIGNLRDITLRALDVLAAADLIACEDTRVTGKLLETYEFSKKMLSYNDHNAQSRRGPILEALEQGKIVALVSDAGTPLISDPGYKLVRDCLDLGITVTPVPGANAILPAVQLSGLPSDRFLFAGFLPPKHEARRKALLELKTIPATLVFYETGPRLAESLSDMAEVFSDRPAAVVREITKMFEESRRDQLSVLASYYEEAPPKGEIVVLVGAATEEVSSGADLEARIREALAQMSVKDAAAYVAEATGQKRKIVYELALKLSREGDE